jgi:hypothetical protein
VALRLVIEPLLLSPHAPLLVPGSGRRSSSMSRGWWCDDTRQRLRLRLRSSSSFSIACWVPQPPPGRLWPSVTPCFKCFRHFRLMFQVFHLTTAKVDMGYCICCNANICMLQIYVSIVSCVSDVCFKCFIWIFQKLIWCCTCSNGLHVSNVCI